MKKTLLTILGLVSLVQAASAIPAFARKYGYSCEVCHAPVPHLKAFGEEFMGNGYRIPDKEPPRATVDTGDPLLHLQRDLPLAIRIDGALAFRPNAGVSSDFELPAAVKIMSGGNISDTISYYTYFLMTEDGKMVGLEDTFLAFRDVFGLPISLTVGQYRVGDPIKPTETRLTIENYALYKFAPGDSRISLSYERGIMADAETRAGTEFSVQVVNGNGIEEQDIFDSDKYKSFVGRVAQNLAKGNFRIGFLAYAGKEAGENGRTNSVTYIGPDFRVRLPKVELLLEFVHRTDSNALFLPVAENHKTNAFLAEAIISPWGEKGRTFFALAWNRVAADLEAWSYHTMTLNVNYVLRRNLKLLAEYTHDLMREDHRFFLGLLTAF